LARAEILGTGSSLPEQVVTNDDLAAFLTTDDAWIQQRSGVKERRWGTQGTGGVTKLGYQAACKALEAADMEIADVDFVICTTQNPHHYFPGTACFIMEMFDVDTDVGCLDVRDQCSGFLYGLQVADAFIQTGTYERILMVSAEAHSSGLQRADEGRHITVLFGDGAAALVLGPSRDGKSGLISSEVHADGRNARELWVPGPSATERPRINHDMLDQGRHFPYMNGRQVFKCAVTGMTSSLKHQLAINSMQPSDIDAFFPHQANMRINETVAQYLKLPLEKVDDSIQRYGNCSSASVPIALDEAARSGRIKKGDLLAVATFAAGFTWGAALMRF